MSDIHIDVDGREVNRRLDRYALAMLDLRPFWPKLVPLFIGWMRSQFATEGAWAGDPWPQLSESYAAFKARLVPGKPMLQWSGDIRQAASRPERTMLPQSLTLTIRESGAHHEPVLAFHQTGAGNLPPRPLLFDALPRQAELEVEREAREYADETARRLGL